MVPQCLPCHSVIHFQTFPTRSQFQLGEGAVGFSWALYLSPGGVLFLGGSISCSRAWSSSKFHWCDTTTSSLPLCEPQLGFSNMVWISAHGVEGSESFSSGGCSSLGALLSIWVGGHFLGCCLSVLQVVASSLSALSQLGWGEFSLMFYLNLRLFFGNSLSCGKGQISGCFILVLEQGASSFVARHQLFSWGGVGGISLGVPFQLWRDI